MAGQPLAEAYIRLDLQTSAFSTALAAARNAFSSAVTGMTSDWKKFNDEVQRTSRMLGVGVASAGAAVAAGTKKVVDAYADFERSTVELHKKTGLSTERVQELVNVLTDLSTELPTTRKEMVDLATEAAKLGIEGTENIVAVVKAALKLREATGIEAVEGLTAMGKILTALQLPWDQVENLGSAIVKLADVSAADAPEIVQELQKVAAAGHAIGLTGPEIATLITQIISAGNVAGRTGLRLSRILELTASNLDKVAEMMDIPMEEARKAVNENVLAFFLKFAEYVRSLPGRAEKLEALTGAYGAMGRYLLPLVQDQEGFNRLLEAANQAYSKGTELTRQYQLSLETLSTQQKIISGNFDTTTEQIGQGLAPAIKKFNEEVLGPFSQRLVEITRQWAEAQEKAGGFTLPVTFKVAKVRLEGIADAIQAALLEKDYHPALKELSIAVGAVTLGVQAWKLASESIVALKAAMKTKLGGMVFGIGTAVLSAQFVWENLPENIKKAVDRITDEWEKAVEGLPLPAGWKKTIQGWLDQIGESKWTTTITLGVTWALAQGAWKALMATLFGLFQKQGLTAEAAAGGIAVKGLKVGLSAVVKPVWNVVSGAGQALIGALKNALAAAGFSLGGGLAVAGTMFAVGATIGLGITAILKLAKMKDEEFIQSIQTKTMEAVTKAKEQAQQAANEAMQVELPPPPSLQALETGHLREFSEGVKKVAREAMVSAKSLIQNLKWAKEGALDLGGTLEDVILRTIDVADQQQMSWQEYYDQLAKIKEQLTSLPEEERAKIGIDETEFQKALRAIEQIQAYIDALPEELKIGVAISGPTLTELRQRLQLVVPGKQAGGLVPGTGRGDKVLALLEPGEFVVPRWMMRIPEIRDLLLSVWAKGYQKGGPVEKAVSFASELQEVSPYDIDKLIAVIEKALAKPAEVSLKEWGTILGKYGAAVGAIEPVIQMFKRLGIETSGLEEKLARLKSLFGETAEPSLEAFSEALQVSKERAHVVAEAARNQIRAYEEQIEDMELFGLDTRSVRRELEEFKAGLRGLSPELARLADALEDLSSKLIDTLVGAAFDLVESLFSLEGAASEAYSALNVPAGFKGARYEWAAAKPGEPYRPVEEAGEGITDFLKRVVQTFLGWLEQQVSGFLNDLLAGFSWENFVSRLDWGAFVSFLGWGNFLSWLNWGDWVKGLDWNRFVSVLDWRRWVNPLEWPSLLGDISGSLVAFINSGIETLFGWLESMLGPVLGPIVGALEEFLQGLVTTVGALLMLGTTLGLVEGVAAIVVGALQGIGDLINAFLTPISEELGRSWEKLTPLIDATRQLFASLSPVFRALGEVVAIGISLMTDLFAALAPLFSAVAEIAGAFAEALAPAIRAVAKLFEIVLAPVVAVLADGLKALAWVVDFLGSVIEGVVNSIKWVFNIFIGALNLFVGAVNALFGWAGVHLEHLPYLQKGGIVTRPTLAWLGEAGPEAVIPLTGFSYPRLGLAAAGARISIEVEGRLVGDGRELVGVIERVRAREEIVRGKR